MSEKNDATRPMDLYYKGQRRPLPDQAETLTDAVHQIVGASRELVRAVDGSDAADKGDWAVMMGENLRVYQRFGRLNAINFGIESLPR